MPAHITHSIFGNEVLKCRFVNDQSKGYAVCGYTISQPAFEWALQGPDILFFAVLAGNKELPQYGSVMHNSKTDELFIKMQEYAVSIKDTSDFKAVFSYICGFVCHYVLDKNCHPYVYYFQEEKKKLNPRHHSVHNKIESDIDSAMAYCKYGIKPQAFQIPDRLLNEQQEYLPITRLYKYLLSNLYGIKVTEQELLTAFKGSKRYYKLIIDRLGLGLLARLIDFFSRKDKRVYSLLRVKRYNRWVMNYEHRAWRNLQRPEITFTQSFDELFEASKPEAALLIQKAASSILNDTPQKITCGDSFDNGKPSRQ